MIRQVDDDGLITHLKCDVELNLTGVDVAAVNRLAAAELRKLADRLENDEFEDGFHKIAERIGEAMGEVYVDYSGSDPVDEFNA